MAATEPTHTSNIQPDSLTTPPLQTVSAWSRHGGAQKSQEVLPIQLNGALGTVPFLSFILLSISCVGFAGAVVWLLYSHGVQDDRRNYDQAQELNATKATIERLMNTLGVIEREQARRQGDVQRVPALADRFNDLEHRMTELGFTTENLKKDVQQQMRDFAQLRMELTGLTKTVQDLMKSMQEVATALPAKSPLP